MAGRGIAVQIDAPGWLEHAAQLTQSRGHHRQVGQHVIRPQQRPESQQRFGDAVAAMFDGVGKISRRLRIPVPGIAERFDL